MGRRTVVLKYATIGMFFAVISLCWGKPQEHRPPLSQGEVYDLLSNSVPSAKIVADITRYGLAFKPTDAEMDQFRRAGASNAVLAALRHGWRKETSHPLSGTEIRTLLATDTPSDAIIKALDDRGIDFHPGSDYLDEIRTEGASDELVQRLSRATPRAFGADELVQLLESRTDQGQLAQSVTLRGIDFAANDENLAELRAAGAKTPLLEAARNAKIVKVVFASSPPSPPSPTSSPRELKVTLDCGPDDQDVPVLTDPEYPRDITTRLACGTTVNWLGDSTTGFHKVRYADGKVGFVASRFINAAVAKVGGDVMPPKRIYTPEPAYTREARHDKLEGTVILWIVIDTEGNVFDIRESSEKLGDGLDGSAMDTVRKWKFHPATRNGVPVAVRVAVEVSFRLYHNGS